MTLGNPLNPTPEVRHADILFEFLKAEIRNMHIDIRLKFVMELVIFCEPEIQALLKQNRSEALAKAVKT